MLDVGCSIRFFSSYQFVFARPPGGWFVYNLGILSHHSVNENGDENGERLNAFTRNPFSSPFSFTDPRKVTNSFLPGPRVAGYPLTSIHFNCQQPRNTGGYQREGRRPRRPTRKEGHLAKTLRENAR